jgi:hypothetical protein
MHVNPECSSASHIVRQAQLSKYSNFSKLTIKGKKASVKTHLEHHRFTHLADIVENWKGHTRSQNIEARS